MYKILITILIVSSSTFGKGDIAVKITDDMSYIHTKDGGKRVTVQRIQDTNNRLTDDYAKHQDHVHPFVFNLQKWQMV